LLRVLALTRKGLAAWLKVAARIGTPSLRKLQRVHQRGNGGSFRAFVM
jgi:hypothetical protein